MHIKPWQIVTLILAGILGYIGNIYANRKNNQELIAMLKAEGLVVKAKLNSGRLSQQEIEELTKRQYAIENQIKGIMRTNLYLI